MNPANEFFNCRTAGNFFKAPAKGGGIALASMLGQRAWGTQTGSGAGEDMHPACPTFRILRPRLSG